MVHRNIGLRAPTPEVPSSFREVDDLADVVFPTYIKALDNMMTCAADAHPTVP